MAKVDWDEVGSFERFDKLNDELKDIGNKCFVVFKDDGNKVDAEKIAAALKEKDVKGIKARDSMVFVVDNEGKDMEFWLSATAYTNLRQLKTIRDANDSTLVKAKAVISRVSKDNPSEPSFLIEKG